MSVKQVQPQRACNAGRKKKGYAETLKSFQQACILRSRLLKTLQVVSNEGNGMLPHFFLQGLRANAADYKGVVRPWLENVSKERQYT